MGTWDDGLYDNDAALDTLDELFNELDLEPSAARLAGTVALLAQLSPSSLDDGEWPSRIRESPHLACLDTAARAALEAIAAEPDKSTRAGSRPDAHTEALGDYCDGPRIHALFTVPGVNEVVQDFERRAVARLDALNASGEGDLFEHAGDVAPLGILIELETRIDSARLARWRAQFEALDAATTHERDFWDTYCVRVAKGFALLAAVGGAQESDDAIR